MSMNTPKQDRQRFDVVVGDFTEHGSLPLWYGDFHTIEEARKKLEEVWQMHRQSGFDEERAYIYETRQILDLETGALLVSNVSSRISRINLAENWYKIVIALFICAGVFWLGIRPQIVRSQCAEQNLLGKQSQTYEQAKYSTCLKLHGLAS
jgi:hypothetical protein